MKAARLLRRALPAAWLLGACALGWAQAAPAPVAPVAPGLHGIVRVAGLALPGAQVTAIQGAIKWQTTTDMGGTFVFPQAEQGTWRVSVRVTGVAGANREAPGGSETDFSLDIAPLPADTAAAPEPELPSPAASGSGAMVANGDAALAVNGSQDNGAASPFAQPPAFGNARPGLRSLFNGGFGLRFDTSALDARSFSFTGQGTPRPSYNDLTEFFQLGGPLLIPRLTNTSNAPFFFAAYERTRNRSAINTPALVPTLAQRAAPASAQAAALLQLYPLPNLAGNPRYNYQAAVPTDQHADSLQTRISKFFSVSDQLSGTFNLQSTRTGNGSLFGFEDGSATRGLNTGLNWRHGFGRTFYTTLGFEYSRLRTRLTPFFADRVNLEANAGIAGADAAPANWGPPLLTFSSGVAGLSDGVARNNRNQTAAVSFSGYWNRGDHNLNFGGDVHRLQFNLWQQQNPRGSFLFNGDATGSDFGDFLAGLPDAVSLAFGNADKYFRQSTYDSFVTDDWHASEALTLSLGVRWEYGAPMREQYGRLVNLDLAPNFSTAAPVVSGGGGLQPYRRGVEPRLGLAWRPLAASSLVLRAGYGIYDDTSVYLSLAQQMAQQAPLSRSLNLAAAPGAPLTLATGLQSAPGTGADTFAVAPDFRPGYAQTWNASLQQDLPGGYVMQLSYLGTKGTHAVQRSYPNTYPPGFVSPCPACPAGFVYESSNGNSTIESATAQLQRRYHNGLAFTAAYTYAHAMDDAALGGGSGASAAVVAQNWLDLDGERARSDFDRRHLLKLTTQYSTGLGRRGSLPGWLGAAYRSWTVTTQVTAGSGLPLTPATFALIPGTGFTGVRPDLTGAPVTAAPPGLFLNPDAFSAPTPGAWGNAGRNSINGPSEFGLDAGLQRSFSLFRKLDASFRLDATNALNHVSYTSWNAVLGSAQFGLPQAASPMRSVLGTLRVNF